MSAYTTKTALEQAREDIRSAFNAGRRENMVDEMMEALRPYVSPEVLKETQAVKPVDALQEAKAEIRHLVDRMTAGLDAVAEAAGAQRCPHCGEWTMDLIDLTGEDEFGRVESEMFCKRCAPLTCLF